MAEECGGKEPTDTLLTALRYLDSLLQAKRIEVYRSGTGTSYVVTHPLVATSCEGIAGEVLPDPKLHTELVGNDFRAWLAGLLWDKLKIVPRRAHTDRILEVLDSRAMKTTKAYASAMELIHSIESDPLVRVLVEFCHGKSRIEMYAEPLWKALKEFGKSRGVFDRLPRKFPAGPNAFMRRLGKLLPILRHHGLLIETKRSDGRILTIQRLDDANNGSSTSPSADNAMPISDLQPMDDRRRLLLERAKARLTQGEKK